MSKLIYISCPIRGLKVTSQNYGTVEADLIVKENCDKATYFVSQLETVFPDFEFHNPAEWQLERFVSIAYKTGRLSEEDILSIDCDIIDMSSGVIFFDHEFEFSKGMQFEFEHTLSQIKPYIVVPEFYEQPIKMFLEDIK